MCPIAQCVHSESECLSAQIRPCAPQSTDGWCLRMWHWHILTTTTVRYVIEVRLHVQIKVFGWPWHTAESHKQ